MNRWDVLTWTCAVVAILGIPIALIGGATASMPMIVVGMAMLFSLVATPFTAEKSADQFRDEHPERMERIRLEHELRGQERELLTFDPRDIIWKAERDAEFEEAGSRFMGDSHYLLERIDNALRERDACP